jgi:SAM-dependent methyltransferase
MLDELFEKKSKVKYSFNYVSSSHATAEPALGTIEMDVSGRFGRWKSEQFRAEKLAMLCASLSEIDTVLDVGGGNLLASSFFANKGFTVDISDFGSSPYLTPDALDNAGINEFHDGDFNVVSFPKKYDLVWASHVLEHQKNVHVFLEKLVSLVSEGGYLAIAVPPRKPFIVSGHINLFNPGLLLYRTILCGVDCSEAKIFQYDGNICLLVKVKSIELPRLNYDIGDIELLSSFFPNEPSDGFNGDFMFCNLTQIEIEMIYEGLSQSLLEVEVK